LELEVSVRTFTCDSSGSDLGFLVFSHARWAQPYLQLQSAEGISQSRKLPDTTGFQDKFKDFPKLAITSFDDDFDVHRAADDSGEDFALRLHSDGSAIAAVFT